MWAYQLDTFSKIAGSMFLILTQRHVALLSEKAPPITGPRIEPKPHASPMPALYRVASLLVVKTEK
jgi:hypothetical protein